MYGTLNADLLSERPTCDYMGDCNARKTLYFCTYGSLLNAGHHQHLFVLSPLPSNQPWVGCGTSTAFLLRLLPVSRLLLQCYIKSQSLEAHMKLLSDLAPAG